MIKYFKIIFILICIFFPEKAYADLITIQTLKNQCHKLQELNKTTKSITMQETLEALECKIYLNGFIDGVQFEFTRHSEQERFCLPDNFNMIQLANIFIKKAEEKPEAEHLSAGFLLMNIFDKYNCP